ncbi:MAG: PHP domain-containing protein [Desulfurivibrio sp.]|nr:PHP domain-containing protein [Desulfurivibrio sp.]
MSWVDLHIHSTYSDGTMSPAELVALGRQRGLKALALTDHDTVAGVPDFLAQATDGQLELLSGIELSTWYGPDSLHILGYGLDYRHPPLLSALAEIQQARHRRNLEILTRLDELGIKIAYEAITGETDGQVGRPHIARELVRLGVVGDMHHAFSHYLRKGAAAYVDSFRIHALEAVRLLTAAGGAPVLAHPAVLDNSLSALTRLLPELAAAGLAGLEIYYPAHSRKQFRQLRQLATDLQLLVTGGTDFHGPTAHGVPLGGSSQTVRVPLSCYQELTAFLAPRPETPIPAPNS